MYDENNWKIEYYKLKGKDLSELSEEELRKLTDYEIKIEANFLYQHREIYFVFLKSYLERKTDAAEFSNKILRTYKNHLAKIESLKDSFSSILKLPIHESALEFSLIPNELFHLCEELEQDGAIIEISSEDSILRFSVERIFLRLKNFF
jgi:hypothetical protein